MSEKKTEPHNSNRKVPTGGSDTCYCDKCGHYMGINYKYAGGGMNYEEGVVELHGTRTKPEAVLNATQTEILRKNILSNRPDSLLSLLKSYNEAYQGLPSNVYDSITHNDGVSIENATVNMNVSKIANDYDAQRAGEQVMDKIMSIARKSTGQNRVGR